MWFLKSVKHEGNCHFLLVGEEYTVGRRDCSIMIADDPSISRKHATLVISHPETDLSNDEKLSILIIKDVGSKYGTYLNRRQLIGSEETTLKVGDKVTFGQCDNTFEVGYQPIIVSTSCIDSQLKKLLKISISKLGGHIVSEWQKNCTHLVMKEIKVTIKAVCAMVSLKPLVTMEYFSDLVKCVIEQKSHPDPLRYTPKSGEPLLTKENVSFDCKPQRMTLFKNKTFICTSQKQYNKLQVGITLASGVIRLLEENEELKASLLLHPDTVVMKYQSDSSTVPSCIPSHIENIEQELRRNKKRVIPESDIGLAVVFCSTEKYCNPSYNMVANLFNTCNLQSQTLTQGDIYAEETQTSTQSSNRSRTCARSCVEESLEPSRMSLMTASPIQSSSTSKKRTREEEVKVESLQKHLKVLENNESMPNTNMSALPDPVTIPILSETIPREIKIENSSPVHLPERTIIFDSEKNESIESIPTQVWEDVPDLNVPEGFISKPPKNLSMDTKAEHSNIDKELPSKLVNVEYAALCPPRKIHPKWVATENPIEANKPVKNFKKFLKVFSTANPLRVPCIIGGRDLVIYDRSSLKALDEWLSQHPEAQPEKEEVGLFDWQPNPRKRKL